ncbi:MAG: hypothetical protein ACTHJ1_16275 [Bordetella sp.]|uniref:hypothetical protein n=1 Tax=Bordetella sp. TaxID=28081 RepID=UPI003F7C7B74
MKNTIIWKKIVAFRFTVVPLTPWLRTHSRRSEALDNQKPASGYDPDASSAIIDGQARA